MNRLMQQLVDAQFGPCAKAYVDQSGSCTRPGSRGLGGCGQRRATGARSRPRHRWRACRVLDGAPSRLSHSLRFVVAKMLTKVASAATVKLPTSTSEPSADVGHEEKVDFLGCRYSAHRGEIWKPVSRNQQATNAPPGFSAQGRGATVPASMQLRSLPNSVSSEVPQVQSYNYAMVHSQLLIVDPATNRIVSIITE